MNATVTNTAIESQPTIGLVSQSRPFSAKYSGRCGLLGTAIVAGLTTVRTVDVVSYATGKRFTATVDERNLSALQFTHHGSDAERAVNASSTTRFTKAGTEDATTAILAALDAGVSVDIVTAKSLQFTGVQHETWKIGCTGKIAVGGRGTAGGAAKSRAQFVAQVAKDAKAFRVNRF